MIDDSRNDLNPERVCIRRNRAGVIIAQRFVSRPAVGSVRRGWVGISIREARILLANGAVLVNPETSAPLLEELTTRNWK